MIESAAVGPEPEALLPISRHRPDDVRGEPLTRAVDGENRLAEAVEAAGLGSYPEAAFPILEQRSDGIIRQAVPGSEPLEPPIGKPREPATVHADPELAVPGPDDRSDAAGWQTVGDGKAIELSVGRTVQRGRRAEPEASLPVPVYRPHRPSMRPPSGCQGTRRPCCQACSPSSVPINRVPSTSSARCVHIPVPCREPYGTAHRSIAGAPRRARPSVPGMVSVEAMSRSSRRHPERRSTCPR